MNFDMPATGTWEQRGGWCVRQLMRDANLEMHQAAGLVGNLGFESSGFHALQETHPTIPGSKGGRGWAQWTGYHAPNNRRLQFENWSAEHKLSPDSDRANYGFLLFELQGTFRNFTLHLQKTQSIAAACDYTHRLYEGSSDVADGSFKTRQARLQWAIRAYNGAKPANQR